MRYFCTLFDHYYLPRGLALYQSLRQHCPSFQLLVLCMDRECYDILAKLRLPEVYLIRLGDFENNDAQLIEAKQNRTLIEYYFTCTPSLMLFILANFKNIDLITYLDADIFFFTDPEPIYNEIAGHSIAIIEHRFARRLHELEKFGIYNVGWLSFRRDENSFTCLRWWRQRCIEWCHDYVDHERFADQKYLDKWPMLFKNTIVLQHKGANLAPWNFGNYRISKKGHGIWVDEQPLIFFHFHNLRPIKRWLYDPNFVYGAKPSKIILKDIYAPYIKMIWDIIEKNQSLLADVSFSYGIRHKVCEPQSRQSFSRIVYLAQKIKVKFMILKYIIEQKYIVVI